MADDHAAHAIGAYGSAINETPGIDRRELFDLAADPFELHSLHDHPAHAGLLAKLRAELERLSDEVGDVAPARGPGRPVEASPS